MLLVNIRFQLELTYTSRNSVGNVDANSSESTSYMPWKTLLHFVDLNNPGVITKMIQTLDAKRSYALVISTCALMTS